MKVIHQSTGKTLHQNIHCAFGFFSRLKGLMFQTQLQAPLWIKPCNHVHTFFMFFSIDVVFLSPKHEVVALKKNLAPYRLSPWIQKAHSVLETPSGWIEQHRIQLGDVLEFVS